MMPARPACTSNSWHQIMAQRPKTPPGRTQYQTNGSRQTSHNHDTYQRSHNQYTPINNNAKWPPMPHANGGQKHGGETLPCMPPNCKYDPESNRGQRGSTIQKPMYLKKKALTAGRKPSLPHNWHTQKTIPTLSEVTKTQAPWLPLYQKATNGGTRHQKENHKRPGPLTKLSQHHRETSFFPQFPKLDVQYI